MAGAAELSAAQSGFGADAAAAGEPACRNTSSTRKKPSGAAQPDITTPEGLRDRAILETFYSTGMRRLEIANLKLYDIDARARHGDDPPGQGQEGPAHPDR